MTRQNDNWGQRARIGMFIVGSEAVPEAEWWAMAPPNVSVHAARVTAPAPWARWSDDKSHVTLSDDLKHGAEQFSAMRLSTVVLGHSSSSFLGSKGWDEAVAQKISEAMKPGVQVTTNGLDTVAALTASKVQRPFLILPPWFDDRVLELGLQYYRDHGFAPAGALGFDPGPKWRDVPKKDHYPLGLGFEQEIEPLYQQICAAMPDEADGVLIAGTGFRCVAILNDLEKELGRPVVSANQASLWHSLRLSGLRDTISGYGNLFNL